MVRPQSKRKQSPSNQQTNDVGGHGMCPPVSLRALSSSLQEIVFSFKNHKIIEATVFRKNLFAALPVSTAKVQSNFQKVQFKQQQQKYSQDLRKLFTNIIPSGKKVRGMLVMNHHTQVSTVEESSVSQELH